MDETDFDFENRQDDDSERETFRAKLMSTCSHASMQQWLVSLGQGWRMAPGLNNKALGGRSHSNTYTPLTTQLTAILPNKQRLPM